MGRSGYRVGQGVDVHRFDASRAMRLCGVELDGIGPGLSGHSDADVALHAVTDALLGAVGAGDIGEHFPPTDPRWRDADSREFVRFAMERVAEEGYRVSSCDLTVIGERPKIAPHRAQLRAGLASSLGVAVDRVNVKATTSEGLGFVGRCEGLAAMAVVLVELADA